MSETGDMDAFAAEYVLGTLESGERAQALALMTIDPGFVAKIHLWERRLSELHLMVEPIEPDGKIWDRIKGKLPAATPSPAPPSPVVQLPETQAPKTADTSERAEPPEPAEDATPSGVFDELPTPTPATMPAAPQLPSFLIPQGAAPAVESPPTAVTPAPAVTATPGVTPAPAAAPTPTAEPAPTAASAPTVPLTPAARRTPIVEPRAQPSEKGGGGWIWRAITVMMTLAIITIALLVGAWRYAPDRLPPALQAVDLLRRLGVDLPTGPPPRKPPPPESYFDE